MNLPTFTPVVRGQKITADGYNNLLDAVQDLTRQSLTGAGMAGYRGSFTALATPQPTIIKMVELRYDQLFVKKDLFEEQSQWASPDGKKRFENVGIGKPAGTPADVLVWDVALQDWVKTGQQVDVGLHYRTDTPLSAGDRILVYFHKASGMYLPLTHFLVRHGVTVQSRIGEEDVTGYPAEGDSPNVYAVKWFSVRYKEKAGAQTDTPVDKYDNSPRPHAYIMNLATGTGSYIEEGTRVQCYWVDGQWYTITKQGGGTDFDPVEINPVTDVCPVIPGWRTVTADYTVVEEDDGVLIDATSGNVTVTLPAPANGLEFVFKRIDSSGNTATIDGGANNIDGATTAVLAAQWNSLTVSSDGAQWYITSAV